MHSNLSSFKLKIDKEIGTWLGICQPKSQKVVCSVVSQNTTQNVSFPDNKASEKEGKAKRVLREIVDTEKTYIRLLERVVEEYIQTIKSQEMLTAEQMSCLFGNMSEILLANRGLLGRLEKGEQVGEVFLSFSPAFSLYEEYMLRYEEAISLLNELSMVKDSPFSRWLNTIRDGRFGLESFLICPVQRVTRYRLLLEELRKCTEECDERYAKLLDACEMVKHTCENINESLRVVQERQEFLSFCSRVDEYDLQYLLPSTTRLLRKGTFLLVPNTSDEDFQEPNLCDMVNKVKKYDGMTENDFSVDSEEEENDEYTLFLLNDCLVLAYKLEEKKWGIDSTMELQQTFLLQNEANELWTLFPGGWKRLQPLDGSSVSEWEQNIDETTQFLLRSRPHLVESRKECKVYKEGADWVVEVPPKVFVPRIEEQEYLQIGRVATAEGLMEVYETLKTDAKMKEKLTTPTKRKGTLASFKSGAKSIVDKLTRRTPTKKRKKLDINFHNK